MAAWGASKRSFFVKIERFNCCLFFFRFNGCGDLPETEDKGLPLCQEFELESDAVTVHSDYKAVRDKNGKSNIFNDIALVRLPRPARLNAGVQMVCLPIDDREYR